MTSFQERYEAKLRARLGNPADRSYRCLCCRDQVLIPCEIARRYIDPEYNTVFTTDVPYFCNRCNTNTVTVDTENGTKETVRYALWTADDSISYEQCQEIHNAELKRLQAFPADPTFDLQRAVSKAAKSMAMPAVEPPTIPPSKIAAFEAWMEEQATGSVVEPEPVSEVKGFRIGDVVMVAIDHFSKAEQVEIERNQEVPIGAVGVIESFLEDDMLKKSGISRQLASVRLSNGSLELLGLSYLRHYGEAA